MANRMTDAQMRSAGFNRKPSGPPSAAKAIYPNLTSIEDLHANPARGGNILAAGGGNKQAKEVARRVAKAKGKKR